MLLELIKNSKGITVKLALVCTYCSFQSQEDEEEEDKNPQCGALFSQSQSPRLVSSALHRHSYTMVMLFPSLPTFVHSASPASHSVIMSSWLLSQLDPASCNLALLCSVFKECCRLYQYKTKHVAATGPSASASPTTVHCENSGWRKQSPGPR